MKTYVSKLQRLKGMWKRGALKRSNDQSHNPVKPAFTCDLPQPTADLKLAKAYLDEFGYCLIADARSQQQVQELRQRLEQQAAAERQQGLAYLDAGPDKKGVNQRIFFLINKGQVFRDLLGDRTIRGIVGHVLGHDYLLSSLAANIANPGGVMDVHIDQWWMPPPAAGHPRIRPGSMTRQNSTGGRIVREVGRRPALIPPAVACNVLWMLADFNTDNGATLVLPGSHIYGLYTNVPDGDLDQIGDWTPVIAPAGTALVLDGRLWHTTGPNMSDSSRPMVHAYFCAPQFRQMENLLVGTSREVLENASPDLLALLGFKAWQGYGWTESPKRQYVLPMQAAVGEIYPKLQ